MNYRTFSLILVSTLQVSGAAHAQDILKADAKHVRLVDENCKVRVVRYHYGPHEQGAFHSHPDSVDVALVDGFVRMTPASGHPIEEHVKAGEVHVHPPAAHWIDNLGSSDFEGLVIEIKPHPTCESAH